MARRKAEKVHVSMAMVEGALREHLGGIDKRIQGILSGVLKGDSRFGPRALAFTNLAKSKGVKAPRLFDLREYLRFLDYFKEKEEGVERSECYFCGEKLKTGLSVEFGDSPANISQHDVGEKCLLELSSLFARNHSSVKGAVEEVKKERLARRYTEVVAGLEKAFGDRITVDDLSFAMMEKLINLRKDYDAEARKFAEYMQGKSKTQAEIRAEFRQRYGARLEESVAYLNSMSADELRRNIQEEIASTKGKAPSIVRLLKVDNLSDEDRAIVSRMFGTTNGVNPEQFARLSTLLRIYFPRNIDNSYGSLMRDLKKRRGEGKISDDAYAMISHLVEKEGKGVKATGEECILLRWADPDDIMEVRVRANTAALEEITSRYNNPFETMRNHLVDEYDSDFAMHSESDKTPAQGQLNLLPADYILIKKLMTISGSLSTADIRSNPTNFGRVMTQVFSMDDFAGMISDLSVLARKSKYARKHNTDLKTKFISKDRFLDEADLSDMQIGGYAAKLGIITEGKSRQQLSEEIADGIIDRVCNTYFDNSRFCIWQADNRSQLLAAAQPKYSLVDKEKIPALFEQFKKVADAKELTSDDRKSLKQANAAGLLAGMPGVRAQVVPYFSQLRYVVK